MTFRSFYLQCKLEGLSFGTEVKSDRLLVFLDNELCHPNELATIEGLMRFEEGYLNLTTWRNIPVRFHWTIPVCAMIASSSVYGLIPWAPAFWLGYLFLVTAHEFGHAISLHRKHLWIDGVDIHGAGGSFRWGGRATPYQISRSAWAGIGVQGVILLVTLAIVSFTGPPQNKHLRELYYVFTVINIFIMLLNLLPLQGFDGFYAWRIFGHAYRLGKDNKKRRVFLAKRRQLEEEERASKKQRQTSPKGSSTEELEELDKLAEKRLELQVADKVQETLQRITANAKRQYEAERETSTKDSSDE